MHFDIFKPSLSVAFNFNDNRNPLFSLSKQNVEFHQWCIHIIIEDIKKFVRNKFSMVTLRFVSFGAVMFVRSMISDCCSIYYIWCKYIHVCTTVFVRKYELI